jgi:hypothetical protein
MMADIKITKNEGSKMVTDGRSPVTHDMTQHAWGHGISIFTPRDKEGLTASVMGHSQTRIEKGDYIIMGDRAGTTRYKVDKIKYKSDPHDLFEATLSFYPRRTCSNCGAQYDPPFPESCTKC